MSVDLLLIRHCESLKNQREAFSSSSDDEALTEAGREQALVLADELRRWVAKTGRKVDSVYSAESSRSQLTADLIGGGLGAPTVTCRDLRSTFAGALAGHSESEARRSHPRFMEELALYRHGLFNAYKFSVAEGKEDKRAFEARVARCVDSILASENGTVKLVVTHRSPITAILIRYARQLHRYPTNFFGYVGLELGKVSWLRGAHRDIEVIRAVNVTGERIVSLDESR